MPPANDLLLRALSGAQRVALWGFGREGRATLAHLRAMAIPAAITLVADAAIADIPDGVEALSGDAGSAALGEGRFDVVVKSPGISLYRPEVERARTAGSVVTSATNLWFAEHPRAKTLAITGTKGKSTTAALAHHLLSALNIQTELGGNVGRPLMEISIAPEVTVMELSSYQIADLQYAPTVAVVLNLYPEHLPWHGDVETYYHDKLRLLNIEPAPLAVLNADSFETRQRFNSSTGAVWFNEPAGYHVRDSALWYGGEKLLAGDDLPLRGRHNLANLAAAMAAIAALGFDPVSALPSLKTFRPLPHRLQEVGEKNGVLYVNDSISTTPQSALAALQAYPGRAKLLLLGGQERGLDYAELASRLVAENVELVLALPDNGRRIAQTIRAYAPAINVVECDDLADAVATAAQRATPGSAVVLSPAAPSFGRFRDYEDRGRQFAQLAGFAKP